jgi:trimethylamine corrinoid protein
MIPRPELTELSAAIVRGEADKARSLAERWLAAGGEPLVAVERGFAAGIREVGELWEAGEYFLPELVQGATAMQAAMAVVLPELRRRRGRHEPRGRVVLGTVAGDLHDIGKSLVGVLLAAHGWEVHDLGTDVPIERFVAQARAVEADVVAASALLTTTMLAQRDLVRAIATADLPRPPCVLIGGAPTTAAWAAEIGAAHAENALRAVAVADALRGGAADGPGLP